MPSQNTLLSLVKDILSDMGSDEVNSIADTEDSESVARIVRSTYNAIISKNEWPHTRRALTISARSDSDFPTHMLIVDNLKELVSVYYDKQLFGETRKRYTELTYLEPDDFLRKLNVRDNTATNVQIVTDDSGIDLMIQNDKHPDYFTSFDDVNLVMDSFLSTVDNTLQISKVQATGYIIPPFILDDAHVPDLPADAYSLLQEEATARCNYKIRQTSDPKSEQEAGRQTRRMSRKNWTVNGGIKYPNYGRTRR